MHRAEARHTPHNRHHTPTLNRKRPVPGSRTGRNLEKCGSGDESFHKKEPMARRTKDPSGNQNEHWHVQCLDSSRLVTDRRLSTNGRGRKLSHNSYTLTHTHTQTYTAKAPYQTYIINATITWADLNKVERQGCLRNNFFNSPLRAHK